MVFQIHKKTEADNDLLREKLSSYRSDFQKLQEEIQNIDTKSKENLKILNEKVQTLQDENKTLAESNTIAEAKIKEYSLQFDSLDSDVKAKIQHSVELATNLAVLNRKCLHFEKQESSLREEIQNLRNDLLTAENNLLQKSTEMNVIEKDLKTKLLVAENELKGKVDAVTHQETQKDLDELNLKYKKLLEEFKELCDENKLELKILTETNQLLKKEKQELQEKLKIALTKIQSENVKDNNEDTMAKKLAETELNEITERQRANHVHNLYELVKEQLQKSEDRFREFETYNKEIMHKNLRLQESLKDLQNQALNWVDPFTFKDVQAKYSAALEENRALSIDNEKLKGEIKILNSKLETYKMWSGSQEYELLSLKHQIVDLQAATDDKTVIARLSTDVVNARLSENKTEQKLKGLIDELSDYKRKFSESQSRFEDENEKVKELKTHFEKSIG